MYYTSRHSKKIWYGLAFSMLLSSAFLCSPECYAQSKAGQAKEPKVKITEQDPVDLTADSLENDENTQTVTAIGNVELVQSGRILRADRVSYNLEKDSVTAIGNVILNEPTGETYFADEFELRDNMKDGFATGVRGLLTDGARFTAKEGRRENGTRLVMTDAMYTACEPCKENPDRAPVWRLVASEVTQDDEEKRISYRDARLEMFGVPVFYTPYFSHPDGSVDQKSGLLTPSLAFDSEQGTSVTQEYYWAIDESKDATIGSRVATNENPLILGEYRQRFQDASLSIAGGVTVSDRVIREDDVEQETNNKLRGHIQAEALWNINEKWRAGVDSEWTSDDQYMREYNISTEDVLENNIYAERFSGRNYARVRTLAFQDIRTSDRQVDQPGILPEIEASFIGEPGQTLGGRWHADFSALSLFRDGKEQDMARTNAELGWKRRMVSDSGLVATLSGSGRADAYFVSDRDVAALNTARDDNGTATRVFAQANADLSYPLVNRLKKSQIVVEPMLSVSAGSNIDPDDNIPNEDSQDTVVDIMNVFEDNRFTGLDRIEDGTKATYGLRTGFYNDDGVRLEVFGGQSYRLDSSDTPFLAGSGLDQKESDYVGMVDAQLGSLLNANYRFQLNSQDLSSKRHEAIASTKLGPVELTGFYFYGVGLEGTEVDETREQAVLSAKYQMTPEWNVFGSARYDLGEIEGLREATYGIGYTGQCFNVSATANRSLTELSSGDSATSIFLRIGLKTLGEFQTTGLSVTDSTE